MTESYVPMENKYSMHNYTAMPVSAVPNLSEVVDNLLKHNAEGEVRVAYRYERKNEYSYGDMNDTNHYRGSDEGFEVQVVFRVDYYEDAVKAPDEVNFLKIAQRFQKEMDVAAARARMEEIDAERAQLEARLGQLNMEAIGLRP